MMVYDVTGTHKVDGTILRAEGLTEAGVGGFKVWLVRQGFTGEIAARDTEAKR